MSVERMSVSLDDFLKYLIKKWYIVITFVLVCCIIFCSVTVIIGKKIEVPPSEEYLQLKEEEDSIQHYLENSIVMKMDPVNIYERILYVSDISDKIVLKDYVWSDETWSEFVNSDVVQYVWEIVTWEEVGKDMEITIRHSGSTECSEFSEYLAEQIRKEDENVKVVVGEQRTVTDEAMATRQIWYLERLEDIQGQLEYTARGYTIEVTLGTSIVLGVFTGGLLAIVALFCAFLLKKQIRSVDEIKYYTNAELIGKCNGIKEKKSVPVVGTTEFEEMMNQHFNADKGITIINIAGKKLNIKDTTEIKGPLLEENDIKEIKRSSYIILGVASNKTAYKDLKKVIDFLKENEKEISGCIAC